MGRGHLVEDLVGDRVDLQRGARRQRGAAPRGGGGPPLSDRVSVTAPPPLASISVETSSSAAARTSSTASRPRFGQGREAARDEPHDAEQLRIGREDELQAGARDGRRVGGHRDQAPPRGGRRTRRRPRRGSSSPGRGPPCPSVGRCAAGSRPGPRARPDSTSTRSAEESMNVTPDRSRVTEVAVPSPASVRAADRFGARAQVELAVDAHRRARRRAPAMSMASPCGADVMAAPCGEGDRGRPGTLHPGPRGPSGVIRPPLPALQDIDTFELVAELGQAGPEDAGHVHLAHADLLGDLGLGQPEEEAQVDDPPVAGR